MFNINMYNSVQVNSVCLVKSCHMTCLSQVKVDSLIEIPDFVKLLNGCFVWLMSTMLDLNRKLEIVGEYSTSK